MFTTQDADRLLGLADQFLEDWEQNEGKNDPECAARRAEYNAIRPLFVAAPKMLEALYLINVDKDGDGFICREAMGEVSDAIATATGKDFPTLAARIKAFTLIVEVRSTSDFGEAPSWARVAVDPSFLLNLVQMFGLCEDNDLKSVSISLCPEAWHREDDLHIRGDSLRVCDSSFWFEGYPKHADYNVETILINIYDLLKAIEIGRGDGAAYNGFRWSGGHLFFGDVDEDAAAGDDLSTDM